MTKNASFSLVALVLIGGAITVQGPMRAAPADQLAGQAPQRFPVAPPRLQQAAAQAAQPSPRSADGIWNAVAEDSLAAAVRRTNLTGTRAVVRVDRVALDTVLQNAPREDTAAQAPTMTLPLPDGGYGRFRVQESPILAPELAALFPEIRTFVAAGVDDPTATARLDWTLEGFHAIVLRAGGTVYVDPYTAGDLDTYVSYAKADLRSQNPFICLVPGNSDPDDPLRVLNTFPILHGTTRMTYRLALAATGEYTAAAGGLSGAVSRITTTMNRVNGIYEREVAVRMTVATGTPGSPTALIYTDGATDPYTNNNGSTMLGQNQANLDAVIGTGNYDIGHVFSTGGGGIAALNSPCNAANKARGVTGLPNPVGDAFDVDYVAHEMGHQFGGNHTFNGTAGSCGGSRSATHAFEVGSGSTIQAYAGICPGENLQLNSHDNFHVESLNEITAFVTNGGGATCGTPNATGNSIPGVAPGGNFTIPVGTPFALTASASDANGDSLTYTWEQYNLGTSSNSSTVSVDDGSRPIFRPLPPTASPTRNFPSLNFILNSGNVPPPTYTCAGGGICTVGEVLPATNRTMRFEATVRDNRAGGGAIATTTTNVTVSTAAGPFAVTSPNSAVTLVGNRSATVTWNVAGSNGAPVNAANVRILLSTDGGLNFPYVLVASTPNSGSALALIPNLPTTTARIKVEAVGNVFFDVSNTNFTIVFGVNSTTGDFDADGQSDFAVFRPSTGFWHIRNTYGVVTSVPWGGAGDIPVARDYNGDRAVDIAIFRPSTGEWFLRGIATIVWGGGSDIPVPADYLGDGTADIAVFRPSTGAWYLRGITSLTFGGFGDIPVPGDYDGNGATEIAVFRPSTGQWFVLGSPAAPTVWGGGSDIPVQADYNGDGRTDIGVFRPSTGVWYVVGLPAVAFGAPGDIPVPADWDGNGTADIAIFRPSVGRWFVLGFADILWGGVGDIPAQKRP